jgi:hypothetical protein
VNAILQLEHLFDQSDPFACCHEGSGRPGCPTCDPDPERRLAAYRWRVQRQDAEIEHLRAVLNTPEIHDFMRGVPLEAAHQRVRWGPDHDIRKTDADWYWLVGHLAGKALHFPEKRLHHQVTAAAALANWHAYTSARR